MQSLSSENDEPCQEALHTLLQPHHLKIHFSCSLPFSCKTGLLVQNRGTSILAALLSSFREGTPITLCKYPSAWVLCVQRTGCSLACLHRLLPHSACTHTRPSVLSGDIDSFPRTLTRKQRHAQTWVSQLALQLTVKADAAHTEAPCNFKLLQNNKNRQGGNRSGTHIMQGTHIM
jgi:hypothetical protein